MATCSNGGNLARWADAKETSRRDSPRGLPRGPLPGSGIARAHPAAIGRHLQRRVALVAGDAGFAGIPDRTIPRRRRVFQIRDGMIRFQNRMIPWSDRTVPFLIRMNRHRHRMIPLPDGKILRRSRVILFSDRMNLIRCRSILSGSRTRLQGQKPGKTDLRGAESFCAARNRRFSGGDITILSEEPLRQPLQQGLIGDATLFHRRANPVPSVDQEKPAGRSRRRQTVDEARETASEEGERSAPGIGAWDAKRKPEGRSKPRLMTGRKRGGIADGASKAFGAGRINEKCQKFLADP